MFNPNPARKTTRHTYADTLTLLHHRQLLDPAPAGRTLPARPVGAGYLFFLPWPRGPPSPSDRALS